MSFSNFEKVYKDENTPHDAFVRTFSDLKEGYKIFFYDSYKIHTLTVKKIELQKFVCVDYNYKYEKEERTKERLFITTNEGVELDFDPSIAKMYDSYQFGKPFFASYGAAEKYLESRINFCKEKARKAQETLEKYQKLQENYEVCKNRAFHELCLNTYQQCIGAIS